MSVFKKTDDEGNKKIKSLGFYTVLALCLLAVGAAAWSATVGLGGGISVAETSSRSDASLPAQEQAGVIAQSEPDERSAASSSEAAAPTVQTVSEEPVDTTAHFFVMPVTGNIIKKYNDSELQYSETYGDLRLHTGIDIAADEGSIIKAAGNGVVEKVYNDELFGNTVVIDHGNGIKGYYCGLNNLPSVSEGDVILSGAQLGSLSTVPFECADAPHLHFAMQRDGEWVSPLTLMNME